MAVWTVGLVILGLLACWLGRRQRIVTSQGWWRWTTGEEGTEHSPRGKGAKRSLVGDCRLIFKPSALALALLKKLGKSPDLEARRWCWKTWPYLQTAMQLLWPPDHPLEFARDHLQVADNGLVALDWVVGPWDESGKGPGASESTVLLVVPSATGKITRNICQLCQLALEKGYYPVIFNRRGHNSCPLTSARLQPFGDPSDLKEAVAYIRFRHPTAMLFAVSEGSGSGLLLSYLGECGSSCDLHGAACISPLLKGQDWFEAGSPRLCEWALLLYQKRVISRWLETSWNCNWSPDERSVPLEKMAALEVGLYGIITLLRYTEALREVVEMERVLGSRSLQEFEEALFCGRKSQPMTWEAYWGRNEPLRDADDVAVPVLCICSADDPVRGPSSRTLPWELFCTNPNFFLLLAPHGGHCGFLQKSSSTSAASWGNSVALEYLGGLAEFFQADEGMKERPRRRRSAILYQHGQGVCQNREVLPASLDSQESFSWQRSYTH